MTCEKCGDARDEGSRHECPEYDHYDIILIITRPKRWRPGAMIPQNFQLCCDRDTGASIVTCESDKIFQANFGVRVGMEDLIGTQSRAAQRAITWAMADALRPKERVDGEGEAVPVL